MKTITPSGLNDLLEKQPDLSVIDVRTPAEFAEVHVPQAKLHPLNELNVESLIASGALPKDEPVYILCCSGQRAKQAAEQFDAKGHDNAVVVEGGTLAWTAAGLPVIRGAVQAISLERQVRIGAGALVVGGILLGWFVHRAFFGLSGFVGAGLVFAGITDWCGMGLLLAKAPWNRRAAG